ncbi:MAG TPA: tetratricopeptide repeat protein, partial [Azospira sp.]|nr:tetratricopeptide repeat protein [Azospira sp.]
GNLGNALKAAGRLADAETCYRRALALNESDPLAHYNLGIALQEQCRWPEASAAYAQALALQPGFAPAHYNLGIVQEEQGNAAAAEAAYRMALHFQPDHVEARYNLACLLHPAGRLEEAEAAYRQVLQAAPQHVGAAQNLAQLLTDAGRSEEAERLCRDALVGAPEDAGLLNTLGRALHARSACAEAEAAFRRAAAIRPDFAEALGNLGKLLQDQERFVEAEATLRQSLAIRPDAPDVLTNLGSVFCSTGRHPEAETAYRAALAQCPDNADYVYNLAFAIQEQERFCEAEGIYRRALELRPDFPLALINLGLILSLIGKAEEAERNCLQALENNPENAKFHVSLGGIRREQGRYAESEAAFRRALELDPDFVYALDNILYAHTFDGRHSAQECLDDARQYGRLVSERAAKQGGRYERWVCSGSPVRLRVGLVSGDLRDHSVGHFLEGFLQAVDPTRLELYAYATHRETTALTERIRPCFARWTSLVGLSDAAAAARIHDDGVHVLIDLSGHTGHNRLPVFAWKPAPVQASWLGYCATTGVAEIDYYLADAATLPAAQEKHFTETVWRLPRSYLCFSRPAADAAVGPLPALANGYVTFGSFNNLSKMTDEVVALWSRLLHAIPGSRLRLKARQLAEATVRSRVEAQYRAHGIDGERLILDPPIAERGGHLAAYGEIDIGLDPFPYNG